MRAEAERLRWLAGRAPVPEVIAFASDITQHYLLLQALPGQDGKQTAPEHADAVVTAFARALRQLHDLPIDECPFDERLAVRIEQARARARAGLVDEDDLDKERRGRSAMELLEQLEREDLPDEDLVVTHGDACLPNAIFDGESFSGFVDCGGAGVADRYQDLALAARSISGNLGVEWVHRFFEAYGLVDPDSSKIAYYRLLDEFF